MREQGKSSSDGGKRHVCVLGRGEVGMLIEEKAEKIHCVLETRFGTDCEEDLDGSYKKMNTFSFCLEQMIQECSVWKKRRIALSWRSCSQK